ncbi:MAG: hypothetical protein ACLFU9_02350 [Candidatus Bathyarchaeia archaeon]
MFVLANAQPHEEELGKEVAETFREIIKSHQSIVEDFIFETKVSVADNTEAKLGVIEHYVNDTLRAKIDEVNLQREELIEELQAGEIGNETFAMEMRALAMDLADTARTMGVIGEELQQLGKELAGALKARADELVDDLQAFAEEMASAGKSIAEEMRNRDLPIPDIPESPGIPGWATIPPFPEQPVETPETPNVPQQPEVPGPPFSKP